MSGADVIKIRRLIEQTSHFDRDERFMALSDLKRELQTIQGTIESELQIPIRDAVLKQLDDGSNEVQGIAVSCLSALVLKFAKQSVSEIVTKLSKLLGEGKPKIRDSCADGLKSIIRAVPEAYGEDVSQRVLHYLLRTIQEVDQTDIDKTNFGLDVLETLLARFGKQFTSSHQEILKALYALLHNENKNLRRRIPTTLGVLVHQLPDEQFEDLINHVISNIEGAARGSRRSKHGDPDDTLYTYIQCIGIIGRHAGVRIGVYLPKIVPLLMKYCEEEKDGSSHEEIMEIREKCLQAFESLILQCPNDITKYVGEIIAVSLKYIAFDPNWQESDGKDDMEDVDDDDGGWDDDDAAGDDDDYFMTGDVDADVVQDLDNAWRIRRASVATLAAFVTAKSGILRDKYNEIAEGFVARFQDRDPDVKLEVFRATRSLVSATVISGPLELTRQSSMGPPPALTRTVSLESNLENHIDAMIRGLIAQVRFDGQESRQNALSIGALSVVREICIVRHGALEPWFDELFPCIVRCLAVNDTALLSKALDLVALLFHYHDSDLVHGYIASLADGTVSSVRSNDVRVKTQALDVSARIVKAIRPDHSAYGPEFVPIVERIFAACNDQMMLIDIEQQVKVASLKAVADILERFGDILVKHMNKALNLLLERMKNQVTQLAALMAVTKIAKSPVKINIACIRTEGLKESVNLLRQQSPETRREAANAMIALLKSPFSDGLDKRSLPKLLGELSPHISDQDLYLAHLIFCVISAIIDISPKVKLPKAINEQILTLLQSPLLQGSEALPSLTTLYTTLLTSANSTSYSGLLEQLLSITSTHKDLAPQAFSAIAQCIAGITATSGDRQQQSTVNRFLDNVDHKEDAEAQISLLCLGEIGQNKDLSSTKAHTNVLNAFGRKSEVVKQAASYSLGRLSAGKMDFYLPILLGYIKEREDRRYLLLNSLKENITFLSKNSRREELRSHVSTILPLLVNNASSPDEGVRTMIAECLGQLEIVDCNQVFSEVEKHLSSRSSEVRQTMVASVRFCLEGGNAQVTLRLKDNISQMISLMKDSNLGVQRQAFLTIDAILKHDPSLVQNHIRDASGSSLLECIYKATVFNPSLVTEKDLGAVTVRFDKGLPLRKAAFMTMGTLVERASYYLEMAEFLKYFKTGVTDKNADIQLTTYNFLAFLAKHHGAEMLNEIDSMVSPFTTGIKGKLKDAKLKGQPAIDANNILRAAVKTLREIHNIEGAKSLTSFTRFYKSVLKTPRLKTMLEEIQKSEGPKDS